MFMMPSIIHHTYDADVGFIFRDKLLLLLGYILKDEDFRELHGIPLLPTADNKFVTFTKPNGTYIIVRFS